MDAIIPDINENKKKWYFKYRRKERARVRPKMKSLGVRVSPL